MKKERIVIFITGFLSCLFLVTILNQLNVFKYNKLNFIDNNSVIENKKPEVIFSVEKNFKDNENEPIDVLKFQKTDYHKYDVELDTKLIKNKKDIDENFPNIDYQMIINGKRMNLHATQINNETYINIKELQNSLNHLNVHVFNDDKILNIYESSGLGIIEYNGEEYIECRDIMERYSVGNYTLPYITLLDYLVAIDATEKQAVIQFQRDVSDFPDNKYYYSLLIKKQEIVDQLPLVLKAICTNELYIKEYLDSIDTQ